MCVGDRPRATRSRGGGQGDAHDEAGVAGHRPHLDRSAVRLYHSGHDRQAQAGRLHAAALPCPADVAAGEALEDPVGDLRRDAGPSSRTVMVARPSLTDNAVSTCVPGGVWVRALARRFAIT